MNPELIKVFNAEGTINPRRIVKWGSADGGVLQATASTEALLGVVDSLGGVTAGRCDVVLTGIAEVQLAGNVTRGGWVTSDADGKGVAAAPATGVNASVIGRAMVSGVSGDIIDVFLAPGQIQG